MPVDTIEEIDDETGPASGGLLQSVRVITPSDNRWEQGFVYRAPGACTTGARWAPCMGATRPPTVETRIVEFTPYGVFVAFECATVGVTETERTAIAEQALEWYQGDQVELELWRGDTAIAMYANDTASHRNDFLADTTTLTALSSPGSTQEAPLMYGLANLQQAIRECLGSVRRGVIHATTRTVSLWDQHGALRTDSDGMIRDLFGNLIVCGAGYDGSSPVTLAGDGSIADGGDVDTTGRIEWAYATGPVTVRLGAPVVLPGNVQEATDHRTNDMTFEASRMAAATFDPCCHFGIAVDLCNTACSANPEN